MPGACVWTEAIIPTVHRHNSSAKRGEEFSAKDGDLMGQEPTVVFNKSSCNQLRGCLFCKAAHAWLDRCMCIGKTCWDLHQAFPLPKEHLKISQIGYSHAEKQHLALSSQILGCRLELLQGRSSHTWRKQSAWKYFNLLKFTYTVYIARCLAINTW